MDVKMRSAQMALATGACLAGMLSAGVPEALPEGFQEDPLVEQAVVPNPFADPAAIPPEMGAVDYILNGAQQAQRPPPPPTPVPPPSQITLPDTPAYNLIEWLNRKISEIVLRLLGG